MTDTAKTRALYNGECPVCSTEMDAYAAYAGAHALPIAFDDLTRSDLDAWGVSEDEAARLLHVWHDGRLHAGFDAFLVLWEQMPRYRWLARIGRVPGLYGLLSWGYSNVAARLIYARHKRRKARAVAQAE